MWKKYSLIYDLSIKILRSLLHTLLREEKGQGMRRNKTNPPFPKKIFTLKQPFKNKAGFSSYKQSQKSIAKLDRLGNHNTRMC